MYFLLHSWRKDRLSPEVGLELLDYMYPDEKVRKFAVELLDCLRFANFFMLMYSLLVALLLLPFII